MFACRLTENREDATDGAIARTTDAVVCASPFVRPRACWLGAASLMYMKMHPVKPFISTLAN